MAVLIDPKLATGETDVQFQFQQMEGEQSTSGQAPMLVLSKLAEKDIDPADRATVIYASDEDKFWDLLIHTRSKDWSGFCESQSQIDDPSTPQAIHDEL